MKGSEGRGEEEHSPSRGLCTDQVPRTQDIGLVAGTEENVMGSVLEMLIDVSVRYNLSCRQLVWGMQLGRVV